MWIAVGSTRDGICVEALDLFNTGFATEKFQAIISGLLAIRSCISPSWCLGFWFFDYLFIYYFYFKLLEIWLNILASEDTLTYTFWWENVLVPCSIMFPIWIYCVCFLSCGANYWMYFVIGLEGGKWSTSLDGWDYKISQEIKSSCCFFRNKWNWWDVLI